MRSRPTIWILLGLLLLAGAWFFWPRAGNRLAEQNSPAQKISGTAAVSNHVAAIAPNHAASANAAAAQTNEFPYRLSNTAKTIGELTGDRNAILLENALIDTRRPLNFSIPKNLQSPGDPGSYIVQANGPVTAAFRALLARAGAEIISYIPNNAYLVRVSAAGAGVVSASPLTAAVIPNEPYYKISSSVPVGTRQATAAVAPSRNSRRQPSLLELAMKQKPLPPGTILTLGTFNSGATATFSQIEKLGGTILTTNFSPFGLMLRVAPPVNWTALALLPGVHIVEPYHSRVRANDLSRATTGVAVNSTAPTNYLNLSGSNVLVSINDSGVDATHPDLVGRVFGMVTNDTDGHGTFVGGEIAGNGTESLTVTNASGSINPGTNVQYRGKAPLAKLFAMNFQDSDQDMQAGAALTNALISNNSWDFDGDTAYDLEAASYDAATRDSLPFVTGSQGVLYVFSAGNDGNGENDGVNGTADSILSPATAKDVITVGALEQLRDITNYVIAPDGSSNQIWLPETDTPFQVAGFSARGNVGIGTEGTAGRYKPDVVSPGTFVISTRSGQWDQKAYYYQSTTNTDDFTYENQTVATNGLNLYSISVPANAVGVQIIMQPIDNIPIPTNMPIYVQQSDFPDPVNDPGDIDFMTADDMVSIPPDGGNYLPQVLGDGFYFAIGNSTNIPVTYDLLTEIITTNALGDEEIVLSNLNNSIGTSPYYYRYESGTSMAAGDVSGTLALIQDFFTNTLHLTPSPALLKALLINGARPVGNYNFNQADGNNYQGWGLINLPNSVPAGSTNATSGSNSVFYLDQSPTNALATGDSHTFLVNISSNATALPFRVTVAWTDPPGNPAAAIKLVNNLDLVVTMTNSTATNIYYGNDIPVSSFYNEAGNTNAPNLDTINPEENVFLPPMLSGNCSVTVIGRAVNVNAVTAQTNNVVQDYALVISSGTGLTPGVITVTDQGNVSHPTSDQLITDVIATNAPLLNQFVGANSPLLGTNTISAGGNIGYATNALITVGMTNQWHFYVVTNNTSFTNAAFITFLPATLAIPRMGVFADSDANSTVPEADIDLYVAGPNDPNAASLTNLNPLVISNCVYGLNGDGASLSTGGTEFVAYSNSAAQNIYYVGVKSETQVASEFAFLPVFSQLPFSQLNPDGSQTVNGVPLPVAIPDGSPAHPGAGYVFGLALYPMAVQNVTVSNQITHQNIGDLIGTLGHNEINDVLNNHISIPSPPGPPSPGPYDFLYDDSQNPLAGSQPSAGGGLGKFVGQQAIGPWILTEVDDSQSQTGSVTGFSLTIQPHIDPSKGVNVALTPGEFFTTYVDVPLAATNLSIFATNLTGTAVPPVALFVRYNTPPTQSNYDATTLLNNGVPPGGSISIGATNQPPLRPGRYFISLFNPSSSTQNIYLITTLGISPNGPTILDFGSSGPLTLPDDAVTTSSMTLTNTDPIASVNVGIRVDHPRISDLVFHLISPDGSRYLLMENRGANTTNGAGASYLTTNTTTVPHNGDANAYTNTINTGTTNGTITLTYDLFTLPDTIDVYYQGVNLFHFDPPYTGNDISGTTNIAYGFPGSTSTEVTIIMNAGGNTNYPGTAWTYSVTSTTAKYAYLTFTDDTNFTTTPIKFAPPPFVPVTNASPVVTNLSTVWQSSFEGHGSTNYGPVSGDNFSDGWHVDSGDLDVLVTGTFGSTAFDGTHYIDINGSNPGTISTNVATVPGQTYALSFAYSKNPDGPANGVPTDTVRLLQNGNVLLNLTVTTNNSWINLGWATTSVVFTATSPSTQLQFASQTPGAYGALLDAVSLTTNMISTNAVVTNLYYFPEQSITPLIGTSPFGTWAMEVQDDRVGAYDSNSPPSLVSWQLEFVLASTNAQTSPPVFTNTPPEPIIMDELTTNLVTNSAVAGNAGLTLTYSLLNPPADGWATINTNTGVITLSPQEVDGPTNVIITTVVTDNGSPALSAQNSFTVVVNEVNTPPFWPPGVPNPTNYFINALSTLTVTNTATDSDIPLNPLTYQLLISPPATNATISANGIITWTPTLAQTNASPYTIETIVTDTNVYALTNQSLSATNYITVTVLPPSSPTNGPDTNIVAAGSINWFLISVPTNADFATNLLLFATGPVNLLFSTNSPPTFPSPGDFNLIVNATNGFSILGLTTAPTNIVAGGIYYLGVQNTNSYAVTNAIEVDFHFGSLMNTNTAPFFLTTNSFTNTIATLTTLVVTNMAKDTDSPQQTLTYRLLAPPGVTINTNGVISWMPTVGQGNTTNTITTIVTDNGSPPLSATNSFVVIVLVPPYSATLAATAVTGTNAQMNGMASPNGSPAFAWFQWGISNNYGNLTTPVAVGAGKSVVYVTNVLGGLSLRQEYHFRLVTSNNVAVIYGFDQIFDVGGITAWGDDGAGQTNVPPVLTNTAVAVSAAFNDSLALQNNGLPIAWGDDSDTQTNVPPSVTNVVAVSAGGNFNLALRNTGRVIAWGDNTVGETNVPATLSAVVAISAGGHHSLALRTNGTVVSWGYDAAGETNVPVNLSNVVAVAGGLFHSLALKNDGTMVAWGGLGDGETNVPAGLNTVVAIAAGENFSMALKANGTVIAFGLDDVGQTDVPPGLSNVVAIAAGSSHCLALKNDGTVVSWGDDSFNQTNVPPGLGIVAAVAGGGFHSLALVALTPPAPNTAPFFLIPNPTNHAINVGVTLTVTNTATDLDIPAQTLTYSVSGSLGGTNFPTITTNGIISWTPTLAQAGATNIITTIVTDNGVPPLSATNSFSVIVYPIPAISSITFTNIGGKNGFLLRWYAPTNDQFQVQWTASLTPPVIWQTFSNIITYTGPVTPTNGFFTFFDDGSQTSGFGAQRFYRLILLGSASPANTPPVLPPQATRNVTPLSPLIVTNSATDSDIPAQTLTNSVSGSLGGTNPPTITTNGIINWTPTLAQAGLTNTITTIVTDNGVPPLSATNSFMVVVNPIPLISSVTFATNALTLHWSAPTNDQFNVQWATNLAPVINWTTFSNGVMPIAITSTNSTFSFTDTNVLFMTEFYRLILLP